MRFRRLTKDQGLLSFYKFDPSTQQQVVRVATSEFGDVEVTVETTAKDGDFSYPGHGATWSDKKLFTAFDCDHLYTAKYEHDDSKCEHRRTHLIAADLTPSYVGSHTSHGVLKFSCH